MTGRVALALALGALFVTTPRHARADPSADQAAQCATRYVDAQVERKAGKLLAARESLLVCSHDPCAPELKVDCERWANENDAQIPSIVVTLRDAAGRDLSEARVLIDGHEVAATLTGKALELDPGLHQVEVLPGVATVPRQAILLAEGTKLRAVSFQLAAEPPPPPAPRVLWPGYVAGGAAVLAAGGVLGFGLEGLAQRSDQCDAGKCSQGGYDIVHRWYLATDVSLGVAVAGAGFATIWFLTHRRSTDGKASLASGPVWTF
jgi:hypothetical protein